MEPISWEQTRRELIALELPDVVLTAFEDPEAVPASLQWVMRAPGELFSEFDDVGIYPPGAITLLWADHTGNSIVGHRWAGGEVGFLRFFLETAEVIEEGLSFEQLVVKELIAVWEDEDESDEAAEARLRDAAQRLAFPETERLLAALRTTPRATWDEHQAFIAAFRASL